MSAGTLAKAEGSTHKQSPGGGNAFRDFFHVKFHTKSKQPSRYLLFTLYDRSKELWVSVRKIRATKGKKKNSSAKKGEQTDEKRGAMAKRHYPSVQGHPRKEPFNYRQISSKNRCRQSGTEKAGWWKSLNALATDNFISENRPGDVYRYNDWGTTAVGIFTRRQNGKKLIHPGRWRARLFSLPKRNSAHALDGDKVKIQIHAQTERSRTGRRGD